MKSSAAVSRVKGSADGHGVVSHAGVGMLRELAGLADVAAAAHGATASTASGSAAVIGKRVWSRCVDDHDLVAGRFAGRRGASARDPCCPHTRPYEEAGCRRFTQI